MFVCVENAGRSQMAEAFAKKYNLTATSAGTIPSAHVNQTVVEAMRELGIDLSSTIPKMLTLQTIEEAELVVTMGCSVEAVCPAPLIGQMNKKLRDWHLDDPKDKPIEEVRRIRDTIEQRVRMLSKEFSSPTAETIPN